MKNMPQPSIAYKRSAGCARRLGGIARLLPSFTYKSATGTSLSRLVIAALLLLGCDTRNARDTAKKETSHTVDSSDALQPSVKVTDEIKSQVTASVFQEVYQFVQSKEYSKALDLLYKASEDEATKPTALAMAGELLMKLGDTTTAVPVLRAATEADPNSPTSRRWLSAYYYDIGAMDDAIAELDHLVRIVPGDGKPWRLKGLILKDFELYVEAIHSYRESLDRELAPAMREEVQMELAECYVKTKQPELAIEQLANLPKSPTASLLLSESKLAQGEFDEANRIVDGLMEVSPEKIEVLKLKASILREDGKTRDAIALLEKAVHIAPFEFNLRFDLMSAYSAIGDNDKSSIQRMEMNRLRKLRMEFTRLHHVAIKEPRSPQVRFDLGVVARDLGKLELARTWFSAALALDANNPEAAKELQKIEAKLNR